MLEERRRTRLRRLAVPRAPTGGASRKASSSGTIETRRTRPNLVVAAAVRAAVAVRARVAAAVKAQQPAAPPPQEAPEVARGTAAGGEALRRLRRLRRRCCYPRGRRSCRRIPLRRLPRSSGGIGGGGSRRGTQEGCHSLSGCRYRCYRRPRLDRRRRLQPRRTQRRTPDFPEEERTASPPLRTVRTWSYTLRALRRLLPSPRSAFSHPHRLHPRETRRSPTWASC